MENKKIENAIKEIKEIKMTEFEKNNILNNIVNPISQKNILVESPWTFYSFVSYINNKHLVYYVVIPLIIILSGGGVVFASQDSLPDDILYPVKVKVLEPVEGALKFSKIEKAKYQSELAKNRLIEAQALAKENKLDDSTEEKITKLLVNHTNSLNKNIDKVNKNNHKKEVDDIMTSFSAEMNANARILEVIDEKEDDDQDKNQSKKIDRKENQNKDSILPETARKSADSIKDILKEKKTKDKDDYKNKKDKIKVLIEDIDKDLEEKGVEDLDSVYDDFTDDTHNKINEAKKYLEEANKKETEGDEDEADSLLLDSESSIKEAEILINSKMRFGGNKDHED